MSHLRSFLLARRRLATLLAVCTATAFRGIAAQHPQPNVGPKGTTVFVYSGQTSIVGFNVSNFGEETGTFALTATCEDAPACTISSSSITLDGDESVTIPVWLTGSNTIGVSKSVRLVARYTSPSGQVFADSATVSAISRDATPPTLTFSPARNATLTNNATTLTVTACDNYSLGSNTVQWPSGGPETLTSTAVTQSGCASAYTLALPLTLSPGANSVYVKVYDAAGNFTEVTDTIRYDETTDQTPVVTAASTALIALSSGGTQLPQFTNPGYFTEPYTVSMTCAGVVACTPQTTTTNYDPGSHGFSFNYWATAGGVGTVTTTVTYVSSTGQTVTRSATTTVTVDALAPTISLVTPSDQGTTEGTTTPIAIEWCDQDGSLSTYSVTLDGVSLANTFASQSRPGCASAGSSSWSGIAMAGGSHTITAVATDAVGHTTSVAWHYTLIEPIATHRPAVDPSSAADTAGVSVVRQHSFTIINMGSLWTPFRVVASCTGLTGCSLNKSSTFTLGIGWTDDVILTYTSPAAWQQSGSATVIASYTNALGNVIADTARLVVWAINRYEPVVSISTPIVNGVYTTPTIPFSATVCDIDGQIGGHAVAMSGVSMASTYTAQIPAEGCTSSGIVSATLALQPGANLIGINVDNSFHQTQVTRSVTFYDAYQYQPTVTAVHASHHLRELQASTDTFTVYNPAASPVTYTLAADCTSGFTQCVPTQGTLTVGAGQTERAVIAYTTSPTATEGFVRLTATYVGYGPTTVSGYVQTNLTMDTQAPRIIIDGPIDNAVITAYPIITVHWCDFDGTVTGHDTRIDGVLLPDAFVADDACNSAGSSSWVRYPVSRGAHTITYQATDDVGHVTTVSRTFTVSIPTVDDFRPVVTPHQAIDVSSVASRHTLAFTIANAGSRAASYALTAQCGGLANCSTDHGSSLSLDPGASETVNVGFDATGWDTSHDISLTATFTLGETGETIADAGHRTFVLPTAVPHVTVVGPTTVYADPGTTISVPISIVNSGTANGGHFAIQALCDGWAAGSCVASADGMPNPLTAGWTGSGAVAVTAPASRAGSASATVRFVATYTSPDGQIVVADTATTQAVLASYKPVLSPKTSSVTVSSVIGGMATVSVTNTGNAGTSYSVQVDCTLVPNCAPYGPPFAGAGQTSSVPIVFNGPAVGQTGTARVIVKHAGLTTALDEADTAVVSITGADLLAPTITVTNGLAENDSTWQAHVTYTMAACDLDGQLGTPAVTLNGVAVAATFSAGTCGNSSSASDVSMILQPGMNTIVFAVSDGVHTVSVTRHAIYDEALEAAPSVSIDHTMELRRGGEAVTETFAVHNPGPVSIAYDLSTICSWTCSAPSSVTVAAGSTANVTLTFTTPTIGSSGTIGLRATHLSSVSGRGANASATVAMELDQLAPTATIIGVADGQTVDHFLTLGVQWCDADGSIATRSITFDGAPVSAPIATDSLAGCRSYGTSNWSTGSVALGTHTIVATVTDVAGHSTTTTTTYTFALPDVSAFQPLVTPRVASANLISATQTMTFAVRNAGSHSALYQLTPNCGPATSGSCVVAPTSVVVAAGAVDSAQVTFIYPSPLPSSPTTIWLAATYTDIVGRAVSDTGRMTGTIATAAQLYQPLVHAPDAFTGLPSVTYGRPFSVTNLGLAPVTYQIDIATSDWFPLTASTQAHSTLTVNPGETRGITVNVLATDAFFASSPITVTASYTSPETGEVLTSIASTTVSTDILHWGIVADPDGALVKIGTGSPAPHEVPFVLRSTGDAPIMANFWIAECSGVVTNCRFVAPWADSTFNGWTTPVGKIGDTLFIRFDLAADTLSTRGGTIRLHAESDSLDMLSLHQLVSDEATINVRLAATNDVAITPHSMSLYSASSSSVSQTFTVINPGSSVDSLVYTPSCTGVVSGCTIVGTPLTVLDTAQSTQVVVQGTVAGANGATGTLALTATHLRLSNITDTGTLDVIVGVAPSIAVRSRSVNSGAAVARDRCLTIAAGDAAAYECGDLRLGHALPATTTLNKARAPMLVYNSAHAAGTGLIGADVTVGLAPTFTSLVATLTIVDPAHHGHTFTREIPSISGWTDGHARRVVVPFDLASLSLSSTSPVAALRYTFEVRAPNDSNQVQSDTGTVIVVDRSTSAFGKGWWLDGLEQLSTATPDTTQLLWIGGDGSARLYTRSLTNAAIYTVTPAVDRPDTLEKVGSTWRRHLGNGAYVEFDGFLRHSRTVNASQHPTRFVWNGSAPQQLDSIALPMPFGSSETKVYAFGYTNGLLTSVTAPTGPNGARVTSLARTSTDLAITDPGAEAVHFTVDASGHVTARTNRLGDPTRYSYDAASGTLAAMTLDLNRTNAGDSIHTTFCAAEASGLAACASTILDTSLVVTTYDGPRTDSLDVTTFALDRFGAPRVITDALGQQTKLFRGSTSFPMLVTKSIAPNALTTEAAYDAGGRLTQSTVRSPLGSGAGESGDAVTKYFWKSALDLVDSTTSPKGETTHFVYAGIDRIAQFDARGTKSQVDFLYNADHQVYDIRLHGAATGQRMTYDSTALGNLATEIAPSGATTTYRRDALGRVTSTLSPIDGSVVRTDSTIYSIRDLADTTLSIGPAIDYTLQGGASRDTAGVLASRLKTSMSYDLEGQRTFLNAVGEGSASDAATIETLTYDAAHRVTSKATGAGTQSYSFDHAGNITAIQYGGGGTATQSFDRLNRLSGRIVAAKTYARQECQGLPAGPLSPGSTAAIECFLVFPYFPNRLDLGLDVPGDTLHFAYDVAGNLTEADNRYARIRRHYTPSGLLDRDSLAAGAVSDPHGTGAARGTRYTYDLDGRRTSMVSAEGTTSYSYDPAVGTLQQITDWLGNHYRVTYDSASRRDSLIVTPASGTGGVIETNGYDVNGQLTNRLRVNGALAPISSDVMTYDLRGKLASVVTSGLNHLEETVSFAYDGMGAVQAHQAKRTVDGSYSTEEYRNDPFGNAIYGASSTTASGATAPTVSSYAPNGGGRLMHREAIVPASPGPAQSADSVEQVFAGPNLSLFSELKAPVYVNGVISTADQTAERHYYTGDDRLAAVQRYFLSSSGAADGAWEEYWYDALGRRILTRVRRNESAPEENKSLLCGAGCASYVERTWWDGDQMAAESRTATGTATTENSGSVAYVHLEGIDHPVAVLRSGYVQVINYDWRGLAESSVLPNGTAGDCSTLAPASGDGCTAAVRWPSTGQSGTYFTPNFASTSGGTTPFWLGTLVANGAGTTGALYRRHRYYNPSSGQFTQEDPSGLGGGLNTYGFASGDPVNYSDPFGLCPWCWVPALASGGSISGAVGEVAASAVAVGTAAGAAAASVTLGGLAAGYWIGTKINSALGMESVSPGDIVDAVRGAGAKVIPNKTKTGEGVLIKWPDGDNTHIRVENHPIPGSGGQPVEHGNVETRGPDGKLKGEKKHIEKPEG